jgi:beta-fructofuranosidase
MENNLRPLFHITGETGWINDPNGLIKYNGMYHVFFQYYPHDLNWGPMHWGHVVSKDLIHWERMPIALYPKVDINEDGCFSGTSIVYNNKLYLVYTGFFENGGGDNIRQLQCLASSDDGINFQKHGIIIGEEGLPTEFSACDFRDPKIWRENDKFYMLVAARKKGGRGHILLFESSDIFNWTYINDILEKESLGIMIECPDYANDLNLLLYSEQFQPNEGNYHLNIHSCRYAIGNINLEKGKFNQSNIGIVDYGFDFYAPQVFANDNIMIAWLNMWDRNIPSQKYGFAGQLTIPRKVTVCGGKLIQKPIWNYENSATKQVEKHLRDEFKIGALKLQISNLEDLNLKLRQKGDQYFNVTLNGNEIVFDRSKAGEQIVGAEKNDDSLNGIRRMPIEDLDNVEIEIISDEFSLEFFVNGLSASFTLYPDSDSVGLELDVKSNCCSYTKSEYIKL